jgi:hypothetical protein
VRGVSVHGSRHGASFPPFAHHLIKNSCRAFLWGRHHPAAIRHAVVREKSMSEELRAGEDGPYTRENWVEDRAGKRELQSDVAHDKFLTRLFELREALQLLTTLTAFEKRVLRLRFVNGPRAARHW